MYIKKTTLKKEEKKTKHIEKFHASRLTIFLQSTGYTLIMIAILGIIGYYLDHYFETFPTIFIISLAIGYPLTQIYIFRKFRKFAKKQ
ncbi:hypothetical protein COU74_01180 [Candidatus Peregrinibacteria bacterium CG10_big_fil_rev_8_21_14_0_10_36_19]|nr:MAG: hypothetical protein COU74_01180 [Candidatus Peregrinibacteria bacterium CG10_big_fil_rev_8_21_14_0_10_36_19]